MRKTEEKKATIYSLDDSTLGRLTEYLSGPDIARLRITTRTLGERSPIKNYCLEQNSIYNDRQDIKGEQKARYSPIIKPLIEKTKTFDIKRAIVPFFLFAVNYTFNPLESAWVNSVSLLLLTCGLQYCFKTQIHESYGATYMGGKMIRRNGRIFEVNINTVSENGRRELDIEVSLHN